jgi:hypothetical protein
VEREVEREMVARGANNRENRKSKGKNQKSKIKK